MRIRRVLLVLVAALLLAGGAPVAFVYLAPETATRWAVDAERQRAGLVRRQIELPGGLQYVYLEGGQGEPLMLLHGFGANKDNFVRAARWLTPHYRVVVPDHVGFGESARPPDADYGPVAQAERLHALAQALGIGRLHLGGNSMGGQIALTYAARYPGEVGSLWLLDAAGVWSAPESELRRIIRTTGHNPLQARNEAEFRRLIDFVMSDPPFLPAPMAGVMAQERIRNFALEERIFRQIAGDSVEARIAGLATPALIVWGEQDRAIHVGTAQVLHKLLPNSRVVVMAGVGHLPMLESPRESAQEYLKFRAGLAGGTPAALPSPAARRREQ
jgi:pimeloyl-ACP methyl ester carboxylesterase